jgi:hypothetical protein
MLGKVLQGANCKKNMMENLAFVSGYRLLTSWSAMPAPMTSQLLAIYCTQSREAGQKAAGVSRNTRVQGYYSERALLQKCTFLTPLRGLALNVVFPASR